MPARTRRVIQLRTGTNVPVLIAMAVAMAVVVAVFVAQALAEGLDTSRGRLRLAVALSIVLVVMLAIAWLLRGRPAATWDLDQDTITYRDEEIPFATIRRVIVCRGVKDYYGILFFGEQSQLPRLTIRVGHRRQPRLSAWLAIRELLASPHTPSLEGYGSPTVSAREFLTAPPLSATRGQPAVEILDEQLAWVAQGGSPRGPEAPLERFRSSRYAGA